MPLSLYLFTKQSQQKPPQSLRKSAESVCMGHMNLEYMRQTVDMLKWRKPYKKLKSEGSFKTRRTALCQTTLVSLF